MPQQQTRASLRTTTRARRTSRARVITTGVSALAAATLAVTTGVPSALSATAQPAVRATATPGAQAVAVPMSAVTGAQIAGVHVDPTIADAVTRASGALATAEHLTTEGNAVPADQAAQIAQTTSVVRELLRRVDSSDESVIATPLVQAQDQAATATAVPAEAAADAVPATEPATDTAENDATEPTANNADQIAPAVDAAIEAAADAAVTAAAGTDADTAITAAGAGTPAADQAVATALTQQTAALADLISATPAAGVAVVPAPSPEEIAAKKAAEEAAAAAAEAARLAALAAEAAQYGNGQIPEHLLTAIPWSTTGSKLRADAADALIRLNEAFKAEFGTDLGITDSYRSYADQVAVKQLRGRWAAVPGYSNHGFGVAVDLGTGVADFSSPQFAWMKANAPGYGWIHPDWAGPGGSKPEPWHWEFAG